MSQAKLGYMNLIFILLLFLVGLSFMCKVDPNKGTKPVTKQAIEIDYLIRIHMDTVWVYNLDTILVDSYITTWKNQIDTIFINDNQ